jgi:hypothetical protein
MSKVMVQMKASFLLQTFTKPKKLNKENDFTSKSAFMIK